MSFKLIPIGWNCDWNPLAYGAVVGGAPPPIGPIADGMKLEEAGAPSLVGGSYLLL